MASSRWNKVYERLPILLQNAACSLAGINMRRTRHNRTFWRALRFLDESQWWSLPQQHAYQNEQLRRVIKHAYETVPYYREVMEQRKLAPDDIRSVDDLPKLPILEKTTVRRRTGDMLSRAIPENRRCYGHTSGTTGTALLVASDPVTQPWQWAVWWRHRQRFGLKIHQPFVVFAGRSVVPLSQSDPPIWRRNLPMHQTYVSVHHMTKQNMAALVDYLQRRRVAFYAGYPSALYLFATYLLDHGIRLRYPPRITSTGAESLLPHQRAVIERALETEVVDQYGATEQCGNISECEHHTYHVDMEFGVVEFLPLEGLPSSVRRIVCTGFHNAAMPFIRYNIGDIATVSDRPCPCGRAAPTVEKIDGRIDSYVITPDGRQLGRLGFMFKETEAIEEAQFVQDRIDHLFVRVVRNARYGASDEANLVRSLRAYLGDQIKIELDYVSAIPREPNGKFRVIVSEVFRDRYANIATDPGTSAAEPIK